MTPRDVIGFAGLLGAGLLAAWMLVTLRTLWILTRPPRRTYASAIARGRPGTPDELPPGPRGVRPHTSWSVMWRGVTLPAWDIEGDDPAAPVWVLCHGWGDSRVGALGRVAAVAPLASRLVQWDLPGHGEAGGLCTLGTPEADALRGILDHLAAPRVVLFGWSLGAGVAIAAGDASGVIGVVAEAPYRLAVTPAKNMLVSMGLPWRWNLPPALAILAATRGIRWRDFDRAALAARLRTPLLVIHGEADDICPVADGREIAAAAKGEFVAVPGAGHSGLWTDPRVAPACEAAIRAFAARL